MCNDYEQHVTWAEYQRLMQEIALEIPTQQNDLNLRQADDVKIGDEGPVMRKSGEQVEARLHALRLSARHAKGGTCLQLPVGGTQLCQ